MDIWCIYMVFIISQNFEKFCIFLAVFWQKNRIFLIFAGTLKKNFSTEMPTTCFFCYKYMFYKHPQAHFWVKNKHNLSIIWQNLTKCPVLISHNFGNFRPPCPDLSTFAWRPQCPSGHNSRYICSLYECSLWNIFPNKYS